MREIKLPFASIAVLIGLALIGNGIDGSTGAGIALVGSVVAGILGVALMADRELMGSDSQPKRTLRHRWLLGVDRRRRRRSAKRQARERRKEAERDYLRRRVEDRESERVSRR